MRRHRQRNPTMNRYATLIVLGLIAQVTIAGEIVPTRTDAMDNPSKHAWELFMLLNHPAKDPKAHGRGVQDWSVPIGSPGTTVTWETWRLASTEVFLEKGKKPPEWDDMSLPGSPVNGKVPEVPKSLALSQLNGKKPN